MSEDPFIETTMGPLFVEYSFRAYETTGNWRIPDEQRGLLSRTLHKPMAEIATSAWLAEQRAQAQFEELQASADNFAVVGVHNE